MPPLFCGHATRNDDDRRASEWGSLRRHAPDPASPAYRPSVLRGVRRYPGVGTGDQGGVGGWSKKEGSLMLPPISRLVRPAR